MQPQGSPTSLSTPYCAGTASCPAFPHYGHSTGLSITSPTPHPSYGHGTGLSITSPLPACPKTYPHLQSSLQIDELRATLNHTFSLKLAPSPPSIASSGSASTAIGFIITPCCPNSLHTQFSIDLLTPSASARSGQTALVPSPWQGPQHLDLGQRSKSISGERERAGRNRRSTTGGSCLLGKTWRWRMARDYNLEGFYALKGN